MAHLDCTCKQTAGFYSSICRVNRSTHPRPMFLINAVSLQQAASFKPTMRSHAIKCRYSITTAAIQHRSRIDSAQQRRHRICLEEAMYIALLIHWEVISRQMECFQQENMRTNQTASHTGRRFPIQLMNRCR